MMNDDKMIQVSYGSTNIAEVFLLICPKKDNSLVLLVRDSSVHEGVEYTSEYKVINPNNSEFKDFIDSIDDNIEICVTSQYILEYIKNIDSTHFEFGINENKNSACLLKSDNFILVVIPTII